MAIDDERMDRFMWQEGDIAITNKDDTPPLKVDPKRKWIDPDDQADMLSHTDSNTNNLLLEIARCQNIKSDHSSCKTIIQTQSANDYQLPEPWSGDLENAPILFLSSNPSISMSEKYPRDSWIDDRIIDFFTHRFGGGLEDWTKDGKYTLLEDGNVYRGRGVKYWASARQRTRELFDGHDVRPGVDYAFSEVVHCKSHDEVGVREACQTCTELYLNRIVACSGARLVVCFGRFAADAAQQIFSLPNDVKVTEPVKVGGRLRIFSFMPHPNARMVRTFASCLSLAELGQLRRWLREPGL